MPSRTASAYAPPPMSCSETLTIVVGRTALAHGVPVWADWSSITGSHGTSSTPPQTTATSTRRAGPARREGQARTSTVAFPHEPAATSSG